LAGLFILLSSSNIKRKTAIKRMLLIQKALANE